jgi:hypothetical protein
VLTCLLTKIVDAFIMAVEIICMFSLKFMKTLVFHSAQGL